MILVGVISSPSMRLARKTLSESSTAAFTCCITWPIFISTTMTAFLPAHFSRDILNDLAMHDDWADILLCDTTSGASEPTVDIVSGSDELLLITTPESGSVMDMYGMIKILHQKLDNKMPRTRLIVNRTASREDGRRVASSVRGVMGRFLGKGIHYIGAIPVDPEIYIPVLDELKNQNIECIERFRDIEK